MFGSHRRRFLARLDREKLEAAIRSAEESTAAQIRVAILPTVRGDLVRVAQLTARRLGMASTRDRNGVLIVVVPGRRGFSVWGDQAIHEKLGDTFWKAVVRTIGDRFERQNFTEGLAAGIEEIGRQLATHFPRTPGRKHDDLSDAIVDELDEP